MDVISWVGVVSGLVGSIITIAVGMKKFHSYIIVPILNHFNQCNQCFADVAAMKKKLEYELSPNGGGSLRDESKASSRSLARLEGLILALLNCSEQFIIIFDEKGSALWSNSAFERKLGWNEADLLGLGWKNSIKSLDRDSVCKEFLDTVKDGRDFIMEFNYVHKDDSSKIYRVKAHCHPIKKNNGEIIAFLSFAMDTLNKSE